MWELILVYGVGTKTYRGEQQAIETKRYYIERAAYMRELAESAQTDALRKSCLKAAEAYDILAENRGEVSGDDDRE